MTLTKEVVVDKIEVMENNAIQVRKVIRVLEDGEVLSQSYHRHVLQFGDDLTNEDPKVVAIASAAWASYAFDESQVDHGLSGEIVGEEAITDTIFTSSLVLTEEE